MPPPNDPVEASVRLHQCAIDPALSLICSLHAQMAVGPLAPQLVPQQHGSGAILRSMVSHPQLLSPRRMLVDACI